MKVRILTISVIFALILITSFSPFSMKTASAHLTKNFGNYFVQVGWANEPPLTNQMNNVEVTVVKGESLDKGKPVINALANMQLSVKYGTITKPLDFLPSETTDGQYVGQLIPTKTGSYSLVFSGKIEDQDVNGEIALDDVVSSDTLNFPQTSTSGDGGTAEISSKLGTIINQLTSDINDAKNNANNAAQGYANVAKSFTDVKDTTDRLYMISLAGIGIGVAGIVIAVFAISKKGE